MSNICECGCGLPAKEGKRFRKYHNLSADGRAMRWIGHKYEFNYRLVMTKAIGRPLRPGECVHHKNGNPNDDRLENLELCESNSEHLRKNHPHNRADVPCTRCGAIHRNNIRIKRPYCSRLCCRLDKNGRPTSTGAGLIVAVVCKQCGRSVMRKGGGGFCSGECYFQSMRGKPSAPRIDNRILEFNGERFSVSEWARRLGVKDKSLFNRLDMGWSVERALTQPFRKSPAKTS